METNRVKSELKAGRAVSGPILEEVRTVGAVRLLAGAGHDFLWFDTEHNMYDWETLLTLVQYALVVDIVPLIRVTDLSYAAVARALDTGALGVIIPRVTTRDEVEAAVQYAKYPPVGRRGAGGQARNQYQRRGVRESIEWANQETMVIVQVESRVAIERLDEIASVPGVDVVCVGPQDLSIDLGLHGEFDHPDFVQAIQEIVAACERRRVAIGMVSRDAVSFRFWHELGIRFLVCGSDGALLAQAAARDVAVLREFINR
jgi:2-keto-3-deoxy-L-rhamnonate aldolase RhmA